MKIYLALIITLCHISLTLIKRNPTPKEEISQQLFIENNYLYYNSATRIFSAKVTEEFPNRKITDYRFLKKLHLVNEKPYNRLF